MAQTPKFFHVGGRYRVRKDFEVGSEFKQGEVLIFEGDLFSSYDDALSYMFRCESDGAAKQWLSPEDDPLELQEEYFERLAGPS